MNCNNFLNFFCLLDVLACEGYYWQLETLYKSHVTQIKKGVEPRELGLGAQYSHHWITPGTPHNTFMEKNPCLVDLRRKKFKFLYQKNTRNISGAFISIFDAIIIIETKTFLGEHEWQA